MNKQKFISALEKLNLPKTEFVILSGGSLLMRELREETEDMDLSASKKLAEELQLYDCPQDEHGLYKPFENVQMNDDMERFPYDVIDGYQCETLEDILKHKREWNRPKDKNDIEIIESYIKQDDTKNSRYDEYLNMLRLPEKLNAEEKEKQNE